MKNSYICALDLGSSKIASGLAFFSKRGNITNLILESVSSHGIKKGKILDPADLSDAISKLLGNIKVKSGINPTSLYVNIYGQDIITKHSRATIPLAERGNKIITKTDIQKIVEEAKILDSSLEEEIIHQIPISFKVDEQDSIINPLGLYGHKLEVDFYLICVKSSYVQNINRLISHLGYEIKYLFLSGIAMSKVVFSEDLLKRGLNILCDIGSDITQICLFKDGVLHNLKVLPIGGDGLTNELAHTLKIPFELAEEIKKSYATIGEYKGPEDQQVMIKKDGNYSPISRRIICEVITAGANSLIQSVNNSVVEMAPQLENIDSLVVGGRTILIDGFLEMMEATLGIPVRMIRFSDPGIFNTAKQEIIRSTPRFLNYATTLGIISEGIEATKGRQLFTPSSHRNPIRKLISRAKEIYQEYF